jgi:integral membrane protein (TIGR01906 family)
MTVRLAHMFGCAGTGLEEKGGGRVGLFRAVIIGAIILSLPLALITTNVRVAISEKAVYDFSVRQYDAAEVSGIPESELLRANGILRDYLVTENPGALSITVENDEGRYVSLFNARETAHMVDVRNLVQNVFQVQVIALAVLLTAAVAAVVLWPVRVLAAALLAGSFLTAAFFALAGLITLAGFDSAWTQFHLVAFSNDLWRLNPRTDHLIQMFPETFWMVATLVITAVTLVQAALVAAVAGGYPHFTRPREEESPAKRTGLHPRVRPQAPRLSRPEPRRPA